MKAGDTSCAFELQQKGWYVIQSFCILVLVNLFRAQVNSLHAFRVCINTKSGANGETFHLGKDERLISAASDQYIKIKYMLKIPGFKNVFLFR